MKPVKIKHIISSLSRGGRERQLAILVSNTNLEKYPTKIIYFNKKTNSYIDEYGLQDTAIQIKQKGKFKRFIELHKVLKSEKPDIVYTWGNGESISILLLKPFHCFKFINGSVRHGVRAKKFSHYFRTLILHLSKNIVANSKAGLKVNGLSKGELLYNGIENKFLEPLSNRYSRRQELVNVAQEVPLIISVANLVPYKDYFTVLKALKMLKEDGFKFYYLILGDGPMRKEVDAKISHYGLNQSIRIFGNVENVTEFLKISDIFIHSSKGEGCSNAILEAMAAGLPIIATNTGGTLEIVTADNGFLFGYQSTNELYNHIKEFLTNPDKAKLMGRRSKEIIEKDFSITRLMEEYYRIIRKVLN